jgi:hypothetical protein
VPGAAPRGGSHPLSAPLRFQVLRVGFEIAVDDPAARRALKFLIQTAVQPEPPRSLISYEVRRTDNGFEILRNGEYADTQFDPSRVLLSLYARVQRDALAAWPGAAALRAVTGRVAGERFVAVGETLWDRSRVGLALIACGVDIEGDDMAILHDGVVTAYPRPLRVCGLDVPLPPGAPLRDDLPFLGEGPQTGSWALDLSAAGIEWRVTSGKPDTVILLETNYGGQTRISDLPRHETARVLMSCCDPQGNALAGIRAVAGVANGASRCVRLWLGSLDHLGSIWPGLT